MKRGFDILLSFLVLVLALPVLALVALGIRVSSPGPVFYRALRVGRAGVHFEMLKFRSMHTRHEGPVITGPGDTRVFSFGRFLRKSKLDELPQFLNVLIGDMSIVGPRPEDPKIVDQCYNPWMRETLDVRPGITSPGAVFYYCFAEKLLDGQDPESSYVERILPPKLAIERAYLERATLASDLAVMLRTCLAILGEVSGHPIPPDRRDMAAARHWLGQDVSTWLN